MSEQDYEVKRRLNLLRTAQCVVLCGFCHLLDKLDLWDGAWWWSGFFLAFSAYYIAETLVLEWNGKP